MKLSPDPDLCQVCHYWLCRLGEENQRAGTPGAFAARKRLTRELDAHVEHAHNVADLVNEGSR